MSNIDTMIATPSAARFRMPALPCAFGTGASVAGRHSTSGADGHSSTGFDTAAYGVAVSASLKGAFEGVRAWSPPD